jgi:uncharacterized protein
MKSSLYNHITPSYFDGSLILYNSFTGAFATLPETELDHISNLLDQPSNEPSELNQLLVNGGFIIPEDFDEQQAVESRYAEKDLNKHAISLTIAPTINCNLRCTYCYQTHPKKRMDENNIQAIKHYIQERIDKATAISITWFGGEPLLALPVIKELNAYFQRQADSHNIPFRQSLITNATMLHGAILDYWITQNTLKYLQITLDGMPEDHDMRRIMVGDKPTFNVILDNAIRASNYFPITLRINIDKNNVDGLDRLLDALEAAGINDNISLYLGHIQAYTDVCNDIDDISLSKAEFAAAEILFYSSLIERGIRPHLSLPKPYAGNICVADHPQGAVFAPEGKIFKCWNETAQSTELASGSLYQEAKHSEQHKHNLSTWQTYDPFAHEECKTCLVKPLCKGGCPWEARKKPTQGPGDCSSLRYNLSEYLQLFHLMKRIDNYDHNQEIGADRDMKICS